MDITRNTLSAILAAALLDGGDGTASEPLDA